MKPEIATPIVAVVGFVINLVWAIHNLHVRAEIRKMIDDVKDYVRAECVTQNFCNERNSEIMRRLDSIGA